MRWLIFTLVALSIPCRAQLWSGVLAPARAVNWGANAGAVPGSPGALPDATWTQCGSTVAAYGSSGSPQSASTINTALSGCTAGHYVQLGPGSFYLNTSIVPTVNQTEVRGMGSNATFLLFYGTSGANPGAYGVSLQGSNNAPGAEQNFATWTAGFSQGATSITLSNSTHIVANQTIIALDQQDEAADTGNIWNCVTSACGGFGSSSFPRTDHTCSSSVSPNVGTCSQVQYVLVTACSPSCNSGSSTTLTISPGLYANNWASAKSTGAWWATTVAYQMGARDLSIDMTNDGGNGSPIAVFNCNGCFVFQNRTIYGQRNHIQVTYSKNVTVMSNYMFNDSNSGTSSYAVELSDTSDVLGINNICQQVVECFVNNGGGAGDAIGYNFAIYSLSAPGTNNLTAMDFDHASGNQFYLWEGDFSPGAEEDNTHGTHAFFTYFRNTYPGQATNCSSGLCSQYTNALYIYGGSRYGNLFGNVWGQSGYHTTLYYSAPASATCSSQSQTIELSIGCSNPAGNATGFCNNASCSAATSPADLLASSSLAFYDNYDVVTAAACTGTNTPTAGCAAQTASAFQDTTGNPSSYVGVSSPSTLPNSFIFSSKPSFFGSVSFPAIGPDVSGGNLLRCTSGTYSGNYVTVSGQCSGGSSTAAFGGHANANPAMYYYLNGMAGNPDGSGSVLAFNPSVGYAAMTSAVGISSMSGVTLN